MCSNPGTKYTVMLKAWKWDYIFLLEALSNSCEPASCLIRSYIIDVVAINITIIISVLFKGLGVLPMTTWSSESSWYVVICQAGRREPMCLTHLPTHLLSWGRPRKWERTRYNLQIIHFLSFSIYLLSSFIQLILHENDFKSQPLHRHPNYSTVKQVDYLHDLHVLHDLHDIHDTRECHIWCIF